MHGATRMILLAACLAACAAPQAGQSAFTPQCRDQLASLGLDSARIAAGLPDTAVERRPRLRNELGLDNALGAESRALRPYGLPRLVQVRFRVAVDGTPDSLYLPRGHGTPARAGGTPAVAAHDVNPRGPIRRIDPPISFPSLELRR